MKKSHKNVLRVLEFRNHEAFIRDLVKKIPAEANNLGREAKKLRPDSERTRWTRAVKNVFHAAARKLDKETIDFMALVRIKRKSITNGCSMQCCTLKAAVF